MCKKWLAVKNLTKGLWFPNNKQHVGKLPKSFHVRFPSIHGLIDWDPLWTYNFTLKNTIEFINWRRKLIPRKTFFICCISKNSWKKFQRSFHLLKSIYCSKKESWHKEGHVSLILLSFATWSFMPKSWDPAMGKFSCSYHYCGTIVRNSLLVLNLIFEATTPLLNFSTLLLQIFKYQV